jgi:hypothetical protein
MKIAPDNFKLGDYQQMGWAEYSRQRRILLGKNKTGRTFRQPSKTATK